MNLLGRLILKRRLRKLLRLHMNIDLTMARKRWPAWKREQWWRDFIKSPAARKEFCVGLLKEIGHMR
jgi:hypothetical protein